jgi:hypothetical protein
MKLQKLQFSFYRLSFSVLVRLGFKTNITSPRNIDVRAHVALFSEQVL